MDKRSWLWKRKSSDKSAAEKAATPSDSASAAPTKSQGEQDSYKKPSYVQISVEQYSHFNGLEDRVKFYEEQVQTLEDHMKELDEQLSTAQAEITAKDSLAKQHAKVAEEAVSGWEKAEAEALALKTHLESVTLSKLTVEDRAAHLDGALKECMRQIRNLKEDHEQKLQEVVQTKTKQCEKIKHDLESKINDFEQALLRSAAENAAVSRSLQERSNMLVQINDEKSNAEAEIEMLKGNIESCEREINSLKYELHVAAKELEIRNEEKNMSVRSAEVANKQHMEGVKKIAKLESECQRLRGLVRKRLPGPAALAQMKLEVETLGHDYGDSRLKRSPVKPPNPHISHVSEPSLKENEFLTERLLSMEEETKMLKEALAKRNSELLASRNMCAQITSKLQILEGQCQDRSSPKSVVQASRDGLLSHRASNPPSLTSMSEDGNDDVRSCADSWATEQPKGMDTANQLNLMDDFLEMEKLACCSSVHSDGIASNVSVNVDILKDSETIEMQTSTAVVEPSEGGYSSSLLKLKSTVISILKSMAKEKQVKQILDDIRQVVQDAAIINVPDTHEEESGDVVEMINQDLATAVSHIHEFVLFLGKEAAAAAHVISPDGDALSQKINDFSVTYQKVICGRTALLDFVVQLSYVFVKASGLKFNILGFKGAELEISSPDCIDKVVLPEKKVVHEEDSTMESYQKNSCADMSDSTSNPEIPDYEQLKTEKDNMAVELAKSAEKLEAMKTQLQETEHLLAEAKTELASAQNSNRLSETQLKCMAESYRSLEIRTQELETEVNILRSKTETLKGELQEEKRNHQESVTKCNELEEQFIRLNSLPEPEADLPTTKERDLAAAAEKLAECQETIFMLGKQLKSLHPQTDLTNSERSQNGYQEDIYEEPESSIPPRKSLDSAMVLYNSTPSSPSDTDRNLLRSPIKSMAPRHRPALPGRSSASSTPTPEKQSKGFSRFFSSKVKNTD